MEAASTIIYLSHSEIDKQRWNATIESATHSRIYGYSFYLDSLSPGWHGVVASDYCWVLPITHKKKFGIQYLYQPPFTQQLGVFAKANAEVPWKEVITILQKHFKFWEVQWNAAIPQSNNDPAIIISSARNFILDLFAGYDYLAENFTNDLQRNLKKANRFQYTYNSTDDYKQCINLYRQHYGSRMPHVTGKDYEAFEKACTYAANNQMIICRQVKDKDGVIMAIALLLFDGKRIYNMMNTTTAAGRKTAANHFLMNSIIKEFSGQPIILDFEGSDLPGVKAFYENFSPVNEPYYKLKYNALPWPLRLLK